MSLAARAAALNPLGPIFGKELRVTSRKKRSYALRVAYLGLLLLSLLMVYASEGRRYYGGIAQQAQHQAELGASFFTVFSIFCVCAMGLIAPVLTSTSIGSEKLAKTLPVLMMTPISTWQIVTGKLLSRLLAALTLMGLSLPVLALVRLLGGVELEQMIAVLCLCTSFAVSSAAVGLLYSTYINRAYAVILLAYGTQLFLYMFVPMIVALCIERNRQLGLAVLSTMFASHPVMSVFAMATPGVSYRLPVTNHWGICCIVQLAFAGALLTMSGLALRRVARREGERATGVAPEAYDPAVVPPMSTPLAAWPTIDARDPLKGKPASSIPQTAGGGPIVPYRTPSAESTRPPIPGREVSDNPILWREIRRPLLPKPWMRVTAVITCIGLLLLTYAALGASSAFDSTYHSEQIGFAFIFCGLFWLLTAVLSATAIASEKESDTWALLIATPVSGSAVVWGKVAGLLRRLIWPGALIGVHFILFTLVGFVPVLTTIVALWVIVTFNSIWIATGLYLSLRMRRVTFAVITNLMLAVTAYAVVPALLYVFSQLSDDPRGEIAVEYGTWHLPYMYLDNYLEGSTRAEHMGYPVSSSPRAYWLPGDQQVTSRVFLLTTFGAGCLHVLVSFLILQRTATSFDSIVGRAGRHVRGRFLNTVVLKR
jgi:ABC-type transport system involved in multi-copper enzyme maturation permease subunit